MKPADNIEQLIKEFRVRTTDAADRRILTAAAKALEQSVKPRVDNNRSTHFMRRFIMKNSWTKFATAAAALIIAAVLFVTFVDKTSTPAYAIEQTIAASHSVRYLHIKAQIIASPNQGNAQVWLHFAETGELFRCRLEMSKGSPNVIVYHDNVTDFWHEKKKMLMTFKNQAFAADAVKAMQEMDPKLSVQNLKNLQSEGKVKIEIQEFSNKSDPVILTATYLPGSPTPDRRLVLYIDQETKLVAKMDRYTLIKDEYVLQKQLEFLEYNKPIDDKMFVLDVPPDTIRYDQTKPEVGLAQGTLTQEKIVVKVAREFFEALIAKDYVRASKVFAGAQPEFLEKMLNREGPFHLMRIISIGKPVDCPSKDKEEGKLFRVPCVLEIEKDGVKSNWSSSPIIGQIHEQPDRWTITGGI
ncbi:MAG: hypothetical protein WC975_01925 [Phycisphaerae bacterium]